MGRIVSVILAAVGLLWLVSASSAQMGGSMGMGGMGGGMSGGMGGMMGGDHMGASGHMGSGDHMGSGMMGGSTGTPELTAEQAQQAATDYATQNLPGYVVERTTPLKGMHMTMYQAELSGPAGETRILHINPWGKVMLFGAPPTR